MTASRKSNSTGRAGFNKQNSNLNTKRQYSKDGGLAAASILGMSNRYNSQIGNIRNSVELNQ